MRRPPTHEMPWHVMARGPRRLELFREEADYREYLCYLKEALRCSACELWGYCLIPNHYHLMPFGSSEQLTECMWRLNFKYARHYNRKYGHKGHAFDAPYKAYPQRSAFFTARKLAYIFLNPVVAGFAKRPADYPWSGYLSFMGAQGSPLPVNPTRLLRELDSDLAKSRAWFSKLVEAEAARPKKPSTSPRSLDLQAQEFQWLNEEAHRRASQFDQRATLVAIQWADLCGIRPQAIARGLGEPNSGRIRMAIKRSRQKREADPNFAQKYPLP